MPKTFTADIGQVQFPYAKIGGVEPNTTQAKVIQDVAKLGLQVDKDIAEARAEGDEKEPLALGGVQLPPGTPLPERDVMSLAISEKDDLNLTKIKKMRDQGLISSSNAKVLVSQSVQSASARRPAYAAEYRKQAGDFFGDFGSGQGRLDQTEEEKRQAKDIDKLQTAAFGIGEFVINQNGRPEYTYQNIQNAQAFLQLKARGEVEAVETAMELRKENRSASALTNFASSAAQGAMSKVWGGAMAELTNKGSIDDLKWTVMANANKLALDIDITSNIRALTAGGTNLSPAAQDQIRKAGHEAFDTHVKVIKDLTTSEVFKKNAQVIKDFIYANGARANPLLASLSQWGPDAAGLAVIAHQRVQGLSEAQRSLLLQSDPRLAQGYAFYEGAVRSLPALEKILGIGKVESPSDAALAAVVAGIPGTKDSPEAEKVRGKLGEAARQGNPNAMRVLSTGGVRANMKKDEIIATAKNTASYQAQIERTIVPMLAENHLWSLYFDGAKVRLQYKDKGTKKPHELDNFLDAYPPQALVRAVEAMNVGHKGFKNFDGDPTFGSTLRTDPDLKDFYGNRSPEEITMDSVSKVTSLARGMRDKQKAAKEEADKPKPKPVLEETPLDIRLRLEREAKKE